MVDLSSIVFVSIGDRQRAAFQQLSIVVIVERCAVENLGRSRGQSIDCAIEVLRECTLDSIGINLICDCLSFFVSSTQTGCAVERARNLDYEG